MFNNQFVFIGGNWGVVAKIGLAEHKKPNLAKLKMEYIYHGDKLTDPKYKKKLCSAVRREDGKCIRGKNSNMLVRFESGEVVVISAIFLRKNKLKL